MGFLGTKSTLIPWEMVEVRGADSSLIVSADDGHVKDEPTFDDDREIAPEFESKVHSYYGLQQSGSSEERGTYADYSSSSGGSGEVGLGCARATQRPASSAGTPTTTRASTRARALTWTTR
jgi:hypothetical protein